MDERIGEVAEGIRPQAEQTSQSARKAAIRGFNAQWASRRNAYIARSRAFHDEDYRYLRFVIPEGSQVLEAGCGTGQLLAALKPSRGVGVDLSAEMVDIARAGNPQLDFVVGDIEEQETLSALDGPFDAIVMSDTIGSLEDCQSTLKNLRQLCAANARLVVVYYNYLWEPLLWLAERLGLRMPTPQTNWLKPADIANLLALADFEVVRQVRRQLLPLRLFGLGTLINRFLGTLPFLSGLCLRSYLVARPLGMRSSPRSVTVVIPCRNERGNIEPILRRLPRICDDQEIIFVEGGSRDGTYEEIERAIETRPACDIKLLRQEGKGKGSAVFQAFAQARGEVLMILDADMGVSPEDLPKFFEVLAQDKGEFVNGSRLVYPQEQQAMRLLNLIANHIFSILFTWLLDQRFTDTLCGTKVLRRRDYERIVANRSYFGDFDPFGDFDLLFGAAKLNLKIMEIPVRYAARAYGSTQISRFRHGLLLARMTIFAYWKMKVGV